MEKVQGANLSSSCMQGLVFFGESLQHYEPWAFRMLDAGTKMPEGLLTGSISSFGNYDSCLAVKAVDVQETVFVGKYCALERNIIAPLSYDPQYLARELPKSKMVRKALADVSPVEISLALKGGATRAAYCLPSTCSDQDVGKIVNLVNREADMNFTLSFCETKEQISQVDRTQLILLVLILVLVVFSVSCSLFDLVTRSKHPDHDIDHFITSGRSMPHSLLLSWSLIRSYDWVSRTRAFEDRFAFVYGIRFLAITWIFYAYSYAIQNFTSLGESTE